MQAYVTQLDSIITEKNNKLHMVIMQYEKIKNDGMRKLREKENEIQRLNDKLKRREQDCEEQKAKIVKLKSKLESKVSKQIHLTLSRTTTDTINSSFQQFFFFNYRADRSKSRTQSEYFQ